MPKGRILAVDDQRYFRQLIEGLLLEEGYEAQTVSTGEEALRLLDQEAFDVVITDLVMPAMDGSELVRRIKERYPDQDVVVVTGVVDVTSAIEAMKLGATDYLLKPFDQSTLATSLDSILEQQRLQGEHARLLAENIEYMGERSLFERAIGLFSTLSLGPLADRIVEAVSSEVGAQAGVLWVADDEQPDRFRLTAARGLVRLDAEREVVTLADLPNRLDAHGARSTLAQWGSGMGAGQALFLPLRRERRIVGVVRLSDKLGHGDFEAVDRSCAEKIARFGEMALANALRIRSLERRSLLDPATGAYVEEYLDDTIRKEIEKAGRSGSRFSLLQVCLGGQAERKRLGEARVRAWRVGVVEVLTELIRSTDVVAGDGDARFTALLTESDELGAALLKQRVRSGLERLAPAAFGADGAAVPEARIAIATFPSEGSRLEALKHTLAERLDAERGSQLGSLELTDGSLAASLAALLEVGEVEPDETASQIVRFLLSELARRPRDRARLYLAPGDALLATLGEGLSALPNTPRESDIVVLSRAPRPDPLAPSIVWAAPPEGNLPPFLLRFGGGPAYALVRDEKSGERGTQLFHTADRSLVEHLMGQLQAELPASREPLT